MQVLMEFQRSGAYEGGMGLSLETESVVHFLEK